MLATVNPDHESFLLGHFERYRDFIETGEKLLPHPGKIACVAGFALLTRYPISQAALKFTNNPAWAWTLVTGDLLAFGSLSASSLLRVSEIVQQLFERRKRGNRYCAGEITKIAVAIIVGTLCRVPMAYLSYISGGKTLLFPLAVLFNSAIPIYSLTLFQDRIEEFALRKKDSYINALLCAKEKLIALSSAFQQCLPAFYTNRDPILETAYRNLLDNPFSFITFMISQVSLPPSQNTCRHWTSRVAGITSLFFQLTFLFTLTKKAIASFANRGWQYTGATIGTLANAELQHHLMYEGVNQMVQDSEALLHFRLKQHLASTLYPKTYGFFAFLSYVISGLSWGPTAQATIESEDELPGSFQEVENIMGPLSSAIFCLHPLHDTASTFILRRGLTSSDPDVRKVIKVHFVLTTFIKTLKGSGVMEVELFFKKLHRLGFAAPFFESAQHLERLAQN